MNSHVPAHILPRSSIPLSLLDLVPGELKGKVTILGAVFCLDKHLEKFENLQKAYNALKKAKNNYSYGNYVSLVGKILRLNTYVFSTVWNNAWLIDIKDKYFEHFLKEVEKYLCKYKGQ